ncbi:TPA: O-antigen ligase family protein [Clostridium perfringens]
MPWVCAAAMFKFVYTYYSFAIPALSSVCTLLYQIITFTFLIMFIPLCIISLNRFYKPLKPVMIIPLMVVINIVYIILDSGDISIISKGYKMAVAIGTNDYYGYYFSQINMWFSNMSIVLLIVKYVRNKECLIKCIVSSMIILIIPIIFIVATHPSYLGKRESNFDNGMEFGGGLWNIGVIGFASLSWIGFAIIQDAKKWQKRIIIFSTVLFVFVGVSGISRTLILMVSFSLLAYFAFAKKNLSLLWKMMLVFLAILLFCILESDIIMSILFRFSDNTSGTHNIRFKLWQNYLSHYKECWIIGAPLGSVYNYYRDVNLFGEYFLPHSALVNFFCRYGIIALGAYLVLIKNSFISIQKNSFVDKNVKICVLCGGITYITLAFINQTGYGESVFYVMFGLYLAFNKIEKETVKK